MGKVTLDYSKAAGFISEEEIGYVCDPPAQLSGNHIPALQVPPDSESHGGEAGGSGTGHFRDSSSG